MRTLTLDDLPPGHHCTFAAWQYVHSPRPPVLHRHTFHELFWVEDGEGLHLINGEERPLTPGLLVLVRADDVHSFNTPRPGASVRFVNFAFSRRVWDELRRRELGGQRCYFAEPDHRRREHRLDPAQIERLRALAQDLAAGARDLFTVRAFLHATLALLHNAEARRRSAVPEWLTAAIARLQRPPHFAGGTRALARIAGCTPEHLARETRRHFERTPTEIVNDARLAFAAQQLCTTERPIVDIAADCGLENLGHFYALFRARFGTSPLRYRRHAYLPPEPPLFRAT